MTPINSRVWVVDDRLVYSAVVTGHRGESTYTVTATGDTYNGESREVWPWQIFDGLLAAMVEVSNRASYWTTMQAALVMEMQTEQSQIERRDAA